MNQAEFDRCMPHEFWREVVDRVAAEVPGTLLLAEAFWLMEGYFVRTLGMHRVYNSAFMNMLRDEENAKYRSVIKNTLEFDPDIMKRYVNFMSNPDERTAIDQFGTGRQVLRRGGDDGDAAGAADVRARADRGIHREVRDGVPAAALRGDGGPVAGGAARARDRAAAEAALAVCRERELPAVRLFLRQRIGGRERLCRTRTGTGASGRWWSTTTATERRIGTMDYSAAYADKGAGRLRQRRLRRDWG